MMFEEAKKKLKKAKMDEDKSPDGHIFYMDYMKSVILRSIREDFIGQFRLFHEYTVEDYDKAIRELSDFLEEAGF